MKTSVLTQRFADDRQLTAWIRRLALLLIVGIFAFTAVYLYDRWRPSPPPIVDQRLAALEDAVRANPADVAARGQLADTYVETGRFSDAIAQYDAILATGKVEELARFGRGRAYFALGQLDAAAADYQAVVEIARGGEMAAVDPRLEAAYYQLGSIAMQQGKPQDAIGFLEKALAIMRSDADALYLIGTAFVATGQVDKAVTVLRASVVFVPIGWSEPYAALADAYTKAGAAPLASWAAAMADLAAGKIAEAEVALKSLTGGDAALDASVGLGLLYESRGDTASAATWYRKAVEIDSFNNAALMGLGRVASRSSPAPAASGGPAR
jgi:tetratricopeptide (TPR) repeat protein